MLESLSFTQTQCFGRARNAYPFTKHVSKGGTSAGDGSFFLPFATVQQAIDAIANTGTAIQPFLIDVASGTFSESFALDPHEHIFGAGISTILANPAANWISANFVTAGTQEASISCCQIGAPFVIDFATVASPGAGRFDLLQCVFGAFAITAIGNNTNNRLFIDGCADVSTAVRALTVTNITTRMAGSMTPFLNLVHTCNGAFNAAFVTDVWQGGITINGTSATNFATYQSAQTTNTTPSAGFTGDRISYSPGPGAQQLISVPDADTNLVWATTVVAGATHLANNGKIYLIVNPLTAPRTYTLNGNPGNSAVELEIVNGGLFPAVVVGGVGAPGFTARTLDPGAVYKWRVALNAMQAVGPRYQCGISTLVAGVSAAFIPCDNPNVAPGNPNGQPIIQITLATPGGTLGKPAPTNITNAARSAGGQFKITSFTDVGAVQILDTSDYAWSIVGISV